MDNADINAEKGDQAMKDLARKMGAFLGECAWVPDQSPLQSGIPSNTLDQITWLMEL